MRRLWPLLALLGMPACKDRPPKLADTCVAQADCAITVLGDDCCYGCTAVSGNNASVEARAAWCAKRYPGGSVGRCPELKCLPESVTPYCLEDHCTLRRL